MNKKRNYITGTKGWFGKQAVVTETLCSIFIFYSVSKIKTKKNRKTTNKCNKGNERNQSGCCIVCSSSGCQVLWGLTSPQIQIISLGIKLIQHGFLAVIFSQWKMSSTGQYWGLYSPSALLGLCSLSSYNPLTLCYCVAIHENSQQFKLPSGLQCISPFPSLSARRRVGEETVRSGSFGDILLFKESVVITPSNGKRSRDRSWGRHR